MSQNRLSYRIYLVSTVVISLAAGIFGPFLTLFINQKGGSYEVFGMALGMSVLAQAVAAYYGGHHSDRLGRKPFLIAQGYLQAIVVLLYLGAQYPWHLYVLGIADGMLMGIAVTVGNAFLADLTSKGTRGKDMGQRDALINISSGITMMAGGYFAAHFGIPAIFILMAVAQVIATSLLLFVKEPEAER